MALYNQNYKAINLLSGNTYTENDLGNGLTGSCTHQLFCLASGAIHVTAKGGGSYIWSASTSEFMDILIGSCTVDSGIFVGFKSQYSPGQLPSPFFY